MRHPPASVVFVARTHGLVGIVAGGSILLLYGLTQNLPGIEFGARTYAYSCGIAGLYVLTAVLVWFGLPFGLLLSRVCSLLYLPRPNFGSRVWETMDTAEFRAHFERRVQPPTRPPDEDSELH